MRRTLNLWDLGPASGLAVEPEAGDVAGWLRRSRALAERGDDRGAPRPPRRGPTTSGAATRPPGSSTPCSLYRRGDSPDGTGRPGRGPSMPCPTTPGAGSTSAGCSRRLGWTEESATVLAKARSLCERRLSRTPDDEAAAAALAELLPDADAIPGLDHPPARRDDLRRGRHAHPAARRLDPGRRPESRRRHVHGRGRDRPCPGSPDCGSRPSPTRACRAKGPDGMR